MGTRSQIAVEGTKILFYKHSDGGPSEVLPILMPLVAEFLKDRGFDAEYLPAHICHTFIEADRQHMANDPWYQKNPEAVNRNKFLGYGLDCEIHGDLAYLYTVEKGGTVKVEKMCFSEDTDRPRKLLGRFGCQGDPPSAIEICESTEAALR